MFVPHSEQHFFCSQYCFLRQVSGVAGVVAVCLNEALVFLRWPSLRAFVVNVGRSRGWSCSWRGSGCRGITRLLVGGHGPCIGGMLL